MLLLSIRRYYVTPFFCHTTTVAATVLAIRRAHVAAISLFLLMPAALPSAAIIYHTQDAAARFDTR